MGTKLIFKNGKFEWADPNMVDKQTITPQATPTLGNQLAYVGGKFVAADADYYDSELGKIPDFIKQSASDFKNYGYSSSDDVYKGIVSGVDNYKRTIENAKKYNPQWYEKNKVDIDNVVKALDDVYNSYTNKKNTFGKYASEDEYNAAIDTTEKMSFDPSTFYTDATNKVIAAHNFQDMINKGQYDEDTFVEYLKATGKYFNLSKYKNPTEYFLAEFKKPNSVINLNAEIKNLLAQTDYKTLNDFVNAYDYAKSAKEVQNTDRGYQMEMLAKQDPNFKKIVSGYSGNIDFQEWHNVDYLSDDEKAVLKYYLATSNGDTRVASNYLESIGGRLAYREGEAIADRYKDNNLGSVWYNFTTNAANATNFVDYLTEAVNVNSGFYRNGQTRFQNPWRPYYSASEIATQKMRDNMSSGFWKTLYDSAGSLGQQLPSLIASTVVGFGNEAAGRTVGSAITGLSSAGNTYRQAIMEGYKPNEAAAYGVLNGTSEAVLSYLLNGVGKASGSLTKPLTNKLKGVVSKALIKIAGEHGDSALVKILGFLGNWGAKKIGEAASEFTEEYLQEVLDAPIRNLTLNENNEVDFFDEEAFEAGLVGAFSSLLTGVAGDIVTAPVTVSQNLDYAKYGKELKLNGEAQYILDYALDSNNNDIQDLMVGVVNADSITNTKLGKLYQAIGYDIRNRLSEATTHNDVNTVYQDIVSKTKSPALRTFAVQEAIGQYFDKIAQDETASNQMADTIADTTTQTEDTQNEVDSVLPKVSAAAPEADDIQDWAFKERGLERLTDDQKMLKEIGKAFGREVKFGDLDRWVTTKKGKRRKQRINGFYDRSTGTIYLNTKSSANALITVFKHELTHFAESDSTAYTDFANGLMDSKAFKDWVASKGFKTEGDVSATLAMNADYRDRYGNSGLKGTEVFNDPVKGEHAANLEMVADFVAENLFSGDMSKLQEALGNVEPEAVNKFKQFLLNILNKIKNLFKNKVGGFETIQGIEAEFIKVCNAAQKAWEQKQQTTEQQKTSTEGGGQYKINYPEFTEQQILENSLKLQKMEVVKELTGKEFPKSNIPLQRRVLEFFDSLKNNVYSELFGDVALNNASVRDDLGHGKTSNKIVSFAAVPDVIKKGVVIDSQRRGNGNYDRIVVAAPITIATNKYIMGVMLQRDHQSQRMVLHDVVVINEKETSQSSKTAPSTTEVSETSDSLFLTNILQKALSVNSNSTQGGEKNSLPTQTDSDGRQLSEGQQEYFKDSKVRDDDGKLLVMYQGAQSEFFEFDRKKSSPYNLYGRGFYFTDSKSHANQYGTAREYYLNIKNPVPTSKEDSIITREQMRKYLEAVAENEDDYDIWNYGTTDIDVILDKVFDGRSDFAMLQDVNATAIGDLVAAIELFNEVNGTSFDGIDLATETVTFNSEQAKLTSNAVPTTDPDIRYSLPNSRSDLLQRFKDGEITEEEFAEAWDNKPSKENPVSIANLKPEDANTTPKKKRKKGENKGNKESNLYESIQTSDIFNDSFKKTAKDDSYIKTYQSITNKETLNKAFKELEEGGQQYVNKWFNKPVDEASLVDITVGLILMDRYQRIGDYESAMAATERVREMGTASGREVQILSIISRFTPDMMVKYAQKELAKAFELMVDAKTKRWGETHQDIFKLTADEIETIRRKTLQAAIMPDGSRTKAILLAEICTMLQDKIPPDAGTSIRAWQRISMLLNFKTNIRNIVGNLGMVPIYIASDYWGSVGDWALSKLTGVRTTGVSGVVGNLLTSQGRQHLKKVVKAFGKGIYETYDDFKRGIHTKQEELNRYAIEDFGMVKSDGVFKKKAVIHQGITSGGKSFNEQTQYKLVNAIAKKLNALDNFTSFCLELGDRPFFEMWFMNSLNNQLRLNKTETPTPEMVDIATEEALQRTWQDNNTMTRAVSKIKQAANSLPLHIPLTNYGLGDMLIKFTKTPANIAKAIVDFSPIGLVTAGYKAAQLVKKYKGGSFTPQMQKDVVRTMSNAITGTMFYALVIMGASLGYITFTGDADDDKDVANFEKYIAGVPPYSIEIFGVNVTYDWFQPFGSTLAIAAEFMENQEDPTTGIGEDMWNAFLAAGEVFTQQSFLKSLYEFFSSADENILTGLADLALSDPSTNIPTFLSQVASFFDEDRRSTYDSDSLKNLWNQIRQKLPAVRNQLPEQVNTFGETVENNQYMNVWRAFFSPYNDYPESSGKVADKVYDLYKETGNKSVMPRVAPYKITVKGQTYNFTVEQRNDFQREMGNTSVDMLDKAFKSKEFKQLSDEEKVKVINKIYDYATKQAKIDFLASNYDYELLASLSGENDDGDPILTKEMYKKMNSKAKKHIIEDYFLSKNEMGFKSLDDAVDYYITKAKE